MRISIIQPDLKWEDRYYNLQHLSEMMHPLSGETDLVILPEMFTTGFTMNRSISEEPEGKTFIWMQETSQKAKFALCGSYPVTENGRYYNRFVFIIPEGKSWYYDKRHLFSYGKENNYYEKGQSRVTFTYNDFRIIPFICYDLRFPVWSRNIDDYDLAIYVSSWPQSRISVWNTLLAARAIENQCFVAGSNRIGTDGNNIIHNGMSMIINPKGEIITSASDKETVISANLSLEELREFRRKFNVLRDRDDFSIIP
ncbi:MAG TPA: amidohydrolase [Bacteroidales bacterium]|nr:amidohydrolase [Bacteroidales bacterium]